MRIEHDNSFQFVAWTGGENVIIAKIKAYWGFFLKMKQMNLIKKLPAKPVRIL